jgi:hypothetical protein
MNMAVKFIHRLYKFESYPRFVKDSAGSAVLYLLLMALLFGTISYISVARSIHQGTTELQTEFMQKCPEFVFKDGELTVQGKMPNYVEDKKNNSVFIIDTTGNTKADSLKKYTKGALLTRTHVYYKKNAIETSDFDLNMLKGISFNKTNVINIIAMTWILIPIVYLFYISFYWFAGKLIAVLVLALAGLLISVIMKIEARFSMSFKVAIYALTPAIIVDTSADITKVVIPYFWIIYFAIALCYMILAFRAIKKGA